MWIIKVALDRPYTFIVLALLILLLSPVIILTTPTDIFPNIDIPVVAVAWVFTGLTPQELEGRLTSVYERFLSATVDNIEHIESNTVNGQVIVKVFLQPNADLAIANGQITASSQSILRNLPPSTPQLNSLEEQVAASNQSLKAAEARFQQARAMIRFNRAAQFPTISTAPSITSLHQSGNRPLSTRSGTSADFVLPFDISYEVDLWGRVRRTVAAAREEAQATAADLQNATLILQAELAFDYFELRSADAQKKLLDDTVKAYTDALQLTTSRFEGGAAPKSDVAQAQTQLETTRVQATDIEVQRAQFEHAIAILIGKPPAQFSLAPSPLNLQPPNIPVGVPSELLERRPDIAAFERRMAEANEQIGIARAAFFPALVLGGTGGFEGSSITNWFNWPSRFWAIGPAALQTLFDAGRRRATSQAVTAVYDATVAGYRETTLPAFQQVEDNLAALRILEQEAQQQKAAVAAAQESLQLFTNRYTGGVDNYLQVITAQTIALLNERNDLDILRRRMDASVLLIKALGGGWNISKLPQVSELR